MTVSIKMPALSPTMKEGNLAKWHKKNGDAVKVGDLLAEIETDKATMEIESDYDGVIDQILYSEGSENIAVGSDLAIIIEKGSSVINDKLENQANNKNIDDHIQDNQEDNKKTQTFERDNLENIKPIQSKQLAKNNANESHTKRFRIFASPLAKSIAKKRNINLINVKGSGPKGRIIKSDLEKIIEDSNLEIPKEERSNRIFKEKQISSMRKIIAQRLTESYQNSPHIYLSIDCNIEKMLEIRKILNQNSNEKISINDFIIKASSVSLLSVPESNVSWIEDAFRYYQYADISVAVAIPNGLITPIIKNVENKGLELISKEVKDLASRANQGKLSPEEYQGGTFTISNLGMYGIKNFTAIINPPQSMILAVGNAEKRAIIENDQIKIASIMTVTLSCDHRVIDGAIGAMWLKVFKENIENPSLMLL